MKNKKLKRIVSAIICAAAFSQLGVYSEAAGINRAQSCRSSVIIEGDAGEAYANKEIMLMLLKAAASDNVTADDVLYMNMIHTDASGKYELKTDLMNEEDAVVYVNYNGENLTRTVDTAKKITEISDFSISFDTKGGVTEAKAAVKDKFGAQSYGSYDLRLAVAFYNESGRMIGINFSDKKSVELSEAEAIIDVSAKCPDGAVLAKCFIWQSIESMIPLYASQDYNLRREIACLGDSLTAGAGASSPNKTYPGVLQALIGDKQTVHNYGVGGESAATIAARQGGIEWTTESFTIPAGTQGVPVVFNKFNGNLIYPLWQGTEETSAINPCTINGVEGKLSHDAQGVYYFTRTTAGEAVDVPAGTKIITRLSKECADDVLVINIGTNGGYGMNDNNFDIDPLVFIHKKMVANASQYLIVVYSVNMRNYVKDDIKEALGREFGEHALLLDDYFRSEQALIDAGITPSADDLKSISEGMIPQSLLSDGLHWNDAGYRLLAAKVYEKLIELKYVSAD
ncbi:MAG: SGNH/GDSL hydrolase family protein [Clostridia bacterium]|nr:SGNH/GDSL hydrolase family protein [Clostridia bacterium]